MAPPQKLRPTLVHSPPLLLRWSAETACREVPELNWRVTASAETVTDCKQLLVHATSPCGLYNHLYTENYFNIPPTSSFFGNHQTLSYITNFVYLSGVNIQMCWKTCWSPESYMLDTYILTSIAIEADNDHLSSSYVLLFRNEVETPLYKFRKSDQCSRCVSLELWMKHRSEFQELSPHIPDTQHSTLD